MAWTIESLSLIEEAFVDLLGSLAVLRAEFGSSVEMLKGGFGHDCSCSSIVFDSSVGFQV